MSVQPIFVNGQWQAAKASGSFRATNPATKEQIGDEYPVSSWDDCDTALDAAVQAAAALRALPAAKIADFLEDYAKRIEANAEEIVNLANAETALPVSPRLAGAELPRTVGQLRQAAAAAREESWRRATIDTANNIRSMFAAIGPVAVFGPNNFPLAFGSASGGDFAAAIAAGCPVIGKAHSSHPGTTRLFAEAAVAAVQATGLPASTVQLIYRTSHADGERLVSDPRIGATGYTGSRSAGLKLKRAADGAGKPIYLELSSVNPVAILPGALKERGEKLAEEFVGSVLMGCGQFCTNPGMVLLLDGKETRDFITHVERGFEKAPVGTLLSGGVADQLHQGIATLKAAGAEVLIGGTTGGGNGFSHANTLLETTGANFVAKPEQLQTEALGNASLLVVAASEAELFAAVDSLEGNLTGCIYSDTGGSDDALYNQVASRMRTRVGRLLNDKMPTGVAVSPAMNHGGPYPATGHAGFTAVGIPAALTRFGVLECYDGVRPHRLPAQLQDKNPNGTMWRLIDGSWTQADMP